MSDVVEKWWTHKPLGVVMRLKEDVAEKDREIGRLHGVDAQDSCLTREIDDLRERLADAELWLKRSGIDIQTYMARWKTAKAARFESEEKRKTLSAELCEAQKRIIQLLDENDMLRRSNKEMALES